MGASLFFAKFIFSEATSAALAFIGVGQRDKFVVWVFHVGRLLSLSVPLLSHTFSKNAPGGEIKPFYLPAHGLSAYRTL